MGNERILIVEDDALIAEHFRRVLSTFGYHVIGAAASGPEAIRRAGQERPDLVLMDIHLLGEMNGAEAAGLIYEQFNIPVIYMTAYADDEILQRARITGPYGYLIKPVADRELRAAVEIALYKHRIDSELRRRADELSLLNQASRAFSSTLDLDQVFGLVLEETRRMMGVLACSIWLVEEGEVICRQAAGPNSEQVIGWRLSPGQGFIGWVVERGESLLIADASADGRYVRAVEDRTGQPLHSILTVPMQSRGRIIGALQVMDSAVGRFGPDDARMLELLASSAAIAIENARLYEQAQREIAERKEAEAERDRLLAQVQEQVRRIQQIIETVPEGVLLLDPERRLILANLLGEQHTALLAGAQVGDVLTHLGGRPLDELLTSPPQGLWHNVSLDRQQFEVIARPLEDGGRGQGWVLVSRDVTRQREVEQYAQQQDRLAAVGQLAAGIAHDFNNVLSVILLYARILLRNPNLPSTMNEPLETIDQQAWRASELIRQLLDFSRRSELERSPIDLLVFLKEQVKILERTLPENIVVEFTYGRDGYIVDADPTRIQQAILNLATNARDAMPGGGKLTISLQRVAAPNIPTLKPSDTGGEWIEIRISDTGVGIPPELLTRVFDPFFTTKAPGKGAGLGLSQVYGIVTQHEGHIHVASEVGKGTTFTLYLPAVSGREAAAPRPLAGNLPKGNGELILVVEDQAITRKALVEGLASLNYRTLEAVNGEDALRIFEQRADEIALVLSDLVMPGGGGRTLFLELQRRFPHLKVVLMTGHPMQSELEELAAQGLNGWMLKPMAIERLAEVIARALR